LALIWEIPHGTPGKKQKIKGRKKRKIQRGKLISLRHKNQEWLYPREGRDLNGQAE